MWIGIDPGISGGIAAIDNHGVMSVQAMPKTLRDMLDALRFFPHGARAVCEKLGGMPRDEHGRAKQSPTTMLVMGRNYGHIEMALAACDIPTEQVLPRTWQQAMGITPIKGETKTAKKNRHKDLAQRLFPKVKVTHAIADCLLLAEWLRRRESNLPVTHP